jgi:hypothetical protein
LVVSFVYVLACRLFEVVVLLARGDRSKELEILVLRHELSILRRQVGRVQFAPRDRLLLAALSRVLPRCSWQAFLVTPETLLRWHRRLLAGHWTHSHRRPGRPPIDGEVRKLILRLARENTNWGYVRIVGELRKLGLDVSATLVRNVLSRAFDAIFDTAGIKVIRTRCGLRTRTPTRKRWVGSARRECLDRLLIVGRRQLERVLCVYVRHYNRRRSHRALELRPPDLTTTPAARGDPVASAAAVRRRDLLGGLLHEYEAAAA